MTLTLYPFQADPFDVTEATAILAIAIADKCAPSTIITAAKPVDVDGEPWYDINPDRGPSLDALDDIIAQFATELEYCDARKLLERHPTRHNLVREVEDQS
jgi:hypothetical protein